MAQRGSWGPAQLFILSNSGREATITRQVFAEDIVLIR